MPKEPNELTEHNRRYIDKAAKEFVELATRAVTEKPYGSLSLRFEWRSTAANRYVLTEEQSEMCLPLPAGEQT